MVRINRALPAQFGLTMIGMLIATSAHAVDYSDHGAICRAVEANRTHAWAVGEKEVFQTKCSCEVAVFENIMDRQMFEWAMAWKIDPKAFAKNLPDGLNPTQFMSDLLPVGIKAEQACK